MDRSEITVIKKFDNIENPTNILSGRVWALYNLSALAPKVIHLIHTCKGIMVYPRFGGNQN